MLEAPWSREEGASVKGADACIPALCFEAARSATGGMLQSLLADEKGNVVSDSVSHRVNSRFTQDGDIMHLVARTG